MYPIIKIENLSKQYRLGNVGTGTLSHDLNRWWANIRGKEDPFLKIGETNNQNTKGESDYVWALKDINLEVMPGEVLGIIGKNGAGKSTLLKLLSRVTAPTTGSIQARGRIASLLEVGTGFHPELTGRENIFLNGAILGMTKAEIRLRFDEIVDFAGVERYIDTPVKRYSSGMYVRLAFAVAAHLEPEILVVDEVLAVGDAEFQKKAIGKMQDVSRTDGRTVLFVSHNMTAIKNLCKNCILLDQGEVNLTGNTELVVNKYINQSSDLLPLIKERKDRSGDGKLRFIDFESLPDKEIVKTGEDVIFRIHFKVNSNEPLKNIAFSFSINTLDGNHALVFPTEEQNQNVPFLSKDGYIDCFIKDFPLSSGTFNVNLYSTVNGILADYILNACSITVDDSLFFKEGRSKHPNHPIYVVKHNWKHENF